MNIFDFYDHRSFLRAHISHQPKKGRGEIQRMAIFAGVHPSLLSQILADAKSLNLEQGQLITEYLGLTTQEADYFLNMVQMQRAGSEKLRRYFRDKLNTLKAASVELSQRVRQDRQLTSEEKAIFYSHWLYAAVWLATSLDNGQTLEQIVARFEISRERSLEILKFLLETELVVTARGRYAMGPQSVHLERGSPHLHKHHTSWRLKAIGVSDRVAPEELMYTAPVSLSEADFKKLRGRLAEVIKEVTDVAIQSKAEDLVCFNLDFFRIRR